MDKKFVNVTIDDEKVTVKKGTTILEAAKKAGVDIPTLCFLKGINEVGECRMCIVEVEGRRGFATSCVQEVEDGMIVHTHSPNVLEARRTTLDLLISNHAKECLTCIRSGNCELQDLARKAGISDIEYKGEMTKHEIDNESPSIVRDLNKCILCGRCVSTCKKVQEIGAIDFANRGFEACVSTAGNTSLNDTNCTFCGQCIESCPTGALHEKESINDVWAKLKDPESFVVVQTAPSVRVALGEEFEMEIGINVEGKMITALKKLGFDKVFDTNTGADFTIVEEANEFIQRFKNKENLPMMTSCCPGWVKFVEMNYPEYIPNLSTCKSPQQMFGAIIKSYYAEKINIDPSKICVVAIMPCIAKKYECKKEEMPNDVDYILTTRELARMIKQANIEFNKLEDGNFDNPMGEATGAGAIFGTTGGVMEAALRTAQDLLTKKSFDKIDFEQVRGEKGIKKASVEFAGNEIKVAVASGLSNARKIMEEIKAGKADYQFVEVMACPGGCIMGGGQPIKKAKVRMSVNVRKLRSEALYTIDEKSKIRKSHENPVLKKIYRNYLGKPGDEMAHKLLHTTYCKKKCSLMRII